MKECIKYDANYFRKLTSKEQIRQNAEIQKEYNNLLETMKSYVENSSTIKYDYVVDTTISDKIKILLEEDGFIVTEHNSPLDTYTKISWK